MASQNNTAHKVSHRPGMSIEQFNTEVLGRGFAAARHSQSGRSGSIAIRFHSQADIQDHLDSVTQRLTQEVFPRISSDPHLVKVRSLVESVASEGWSWEVQVELDTLVLRAEERKNALPGKNFFDADLAWENYVGQAIMAEGLEVYIHALKELIASSGPRVPWCELADSFELLTEGVLFIRAAYQWLEQAR